MHRALGALALERKNCGHPGVSHGTRAVGISAAGIC